jgi:AraC-like DNA-binding protein
MRWWISFVFAIFFVSAAWGQVTVVIESLPEATPPEDTIYISGSFNDWAVSDPVYMMRKKPNGQLSISLPKFDTPQEFKFTRGSWMKVETNSQNQYLPNRVLLPEQDTSLITIVNWQDLGGARSTPWVAFYYFAIAFQCIVLLFLVRRIKKGDNQKIGVIKMLTILLLLFFGGAVLFFQINLIAQTYIVLLAQVIFFLWPPTVYRIIRVFSGAKISSVPGWIHYVPVILVAGLSVMRMYDLDILAFLVLPWKVHLSWEVFLYKVIGSIFLLFYLILGWSRSTISYKKVSKPEVSFLLLVVAVNVLIVVLNLQEVALVSMNSFFILKVDHSILLVVLSLIVLVETYYVWRYPEMLKEVTINQPFEGIDKVAEQITAIMQQEKVYRNPDLSVAELSELLGVQKHLISKTLNDHFHKNFRDFVNEYRINEFIDHARSGKLEQYTYLALAHEVGFNSKSTFNLAFKKFTNESPRDFFKTMKVK